MINMLLYAEIYSVENNLSITSGSPPFSEDEIQGLFQDFQGPFSVNSRTYELEKSFKINYPLTLNLSRAMEERSLIGQ